METYSRYTHALTVHPTDPTVLLYGGLTLNRSDDSGDSFSTIGTSTLHPDHQDVVFADEDDPDLLYNVNDGGFYFSLDGGECWNSGNYDLQITAFYSVDSNTEPIPGTTVMPPLVIGGSQDNGTNAFNGPRVWQHVLDGDGGDCAIQDPNVMFASVQRLGLSYEGPYRSLSGAFLGAFSGFKTGITSSEEVAFYPPYLQHEGTQDLFFAAERLYRTSNNDGPGSSNWQAISPDFDPSTTIYPALETENVYLRRSGSSFKRKSHLCGLV